MGDNSPPEDAGSAPKRQALSPADPRWKDYPLGQGPLEQLYEKCATGSIRLDLALKLAASDDIASQLSEAYAWAFGMHAARNAAANRWREGRLQSQILLAAARAARGPTALAIRVRGEREGLVTAVGVLMNLADGRTYKDALFGGTWLIETLDPVAERALFVESCHYLGVLNLDPFAAYRSIANYNFEHKQWVDRSAAEEGPAVIEGLPTPAEALRMADVYFRKAIALAEGDYLDYAIKALIQ